MVDNFYTNHWRGVRAKRTAERTQGIVHVAIAASRIQVSAPYHEDFRKGALQLQGRYRGRTSRWSFSAMQRRKVADLIGTVYGADAVPEWMRE